MWVLEGLVAVFTARAALLDCLPPQVDKLIGIVGGAKKKPGKKGWYTSGAYCESVMKTTRRVQFIMVHGKRDGDLLWQRWYRECKSRASASESRRHCRQPPRRATPPLPTADQQHASSHPLHLARQLHALARACEPSPSPSTHLRHAADVCYITLHDPETDALIPVGQPVPDGAVKKPSLKGQPEARQSTGGASQKGELTT